MNLTSKRLALLSCMPGVYSAVSGCPYHRASARVRLPSGESKIDVIDTARYRRTRLSDGPHARRLLEISDALSYTSTCTSAHSHLK